MMIQFTVTETVFRFALEELARSWSRCGGASPTDKLLRKFLAPSITYPIKEEQC